MHVRCITNAVDDLPCAAVRERLHSCMRLDGSIGELLVGQVYPVYAIGLWNDGGLRVYLHTISESDFPYPYPIEMFEITDSTFPAGWCVNFSRNESGAGICRISFPEWASDPQFFERLVDGDHSAIEIYRQYRNTVEV